MITEQEKTEVRQYVLSNIDLNGLKFTLMASYLGSHYDVWVPVNTHIGLVMLVYSPVKMDFKHIKIGQITVNL